VSTYMRQVWAIVWKDLLLELRTRERLTAMGAFAILAAVLLPAPAGPSMVTIIAYSLDPGVSRGETSLDLDPFVARHLQTDDAIFNLEVTDCLPQEVDMSGGGNLSKTAQFCPRGLAACF